MNFNQLNKNKNKHLKNYLNFKKIKFNQKNNFNHTQIQITNYKMLINIYSLVQEVYYFCWLIVFIISGTESKLL